MVSQHSALTFAETRHIVCGTEI